VRPPPRLVRRVVLAPAVVLVAQVLVTSLPLSLVVAALVSPWVPGRWRPLRLLAVLLTVTVAEVLALAALLATWVGSGFGWRLRAPTFERAHLAIALGYTSLILAVTRRALHLRFDVDAEEARVVVPSDEDALVGPLPPHRRADEADRRAPLVVLARHAGPGDSLLLVHLLLREGFRPRVVLRDSLRWAPVIDVVLHRIPAVFLAPDATAEDRRAACADLARGMRPGDALVLFPEGRNFTATRRLRSIARLEEDGDHAAAERARAMRSVLLPRPGGASAVLAAAPDADVVMVAHTGLEDLSTPVDLWRGLPMDASIRAKLWRVPAQDVPRAHADVAPWLHAWWERIDGWISARNGSEGPAGPIGSDDAGGRDVPGPAAHTDPA
jgi:1-acyl-sn-glycerol-3-phosphate acyltransferase